MIVVDVAHHFLYLTQGEGKVIRYGVGLGRAGFEWSGRIPTVLEDIKRARPKRIFQAGIHPAVGAAVRLELGLARHHLVWRRPPRPNPFVLDHATLYRIHGSPEWWTIGKSVSSGGVRMLNQDVIDLYSRVPNGTPIPVTRLGETPVST